MKKVKIGLVCLLFGGLALSGCVKQSSKPKDTTISSSQKRSSKESSTQEKRTVETSETEETSDSQSSALKLMIEAGQSQMDNLKGQFGDMFSDISITEGNDSTVVYTYILAQQSEVTVDSESLKPVLVKQMAPMLKAAQAVIPDIKFQMIFKNPDGTELVNFIVTPHDVAGANDAANAA